MRGVKGHGRIDSNPDLKRIVVDLYFGHPDWTIEQKLDEIWEKNPEFRLSWSALQRFYSRFEQELVERETLASLARALKADVETDGLGLSAVGGELAQTLLFRKMLSGENLEKDDINKIALQARLQSSAATRERARRSLERDIRRVVATWKDDIRKRLKNYPELGEQIASLADARAEELIQEQRRR